MRRGILVGIWAGLVVAAGPAAAQSGPAVYVRPGDTGAIRVPLTVLPGSDDDLVDAGVSLNKPSFFQIGRTSDLGPFLVSTGQSHTFQINYTIAPNAVDGPLSATEVLISTSSGDDSINPSLESFAFTANMVVDGTPPQVTVYDGWDEVVSNVDSGPWNTTHGEGLSVFVNDVGGPGSGQLFGSGPARLEVWWLKSDGTQQMLGANTQAFSPTHEYTPNDLGLQTLGSLPVGHIQVRAFDLVGNESDVDFNVSAKRVNITVVDEFGRFAEFALTGVDHGAPPTTLSPGEFLMINTSYGAPFVSITANRNGIDISNQIPSWDVTATTVGFNIGGSGIDDDDTYLVTAVNSLGDIASFSWRHVQLYIKGVDKANASTNYNGDGTFSAVLPLKIATSNGGVISPNPVVTINGYSLEKDSPPQTVTATDVGGNQFIVVGFAGGATYTGVGGTFSLTPDSSGRASFASGMSGTGLYPGAVLFGGMPDAYLFSAAPPLSPFVTPIAACPVTVTAVVASNGISCPIMKDTITCDQLGKPVHQYVYGTCTLGASTLSVAIDVSVDPNVKYSSTAFQNLSYGTLVYGVSTATYADPPGNRYDPGQSTATLTNGISLSNLNLSTSASLTAGMVAQAPFGGYLDVMPGLAYQVTAAAFFGGPVAPVLNSPVTVTVRYSTASLTSTSLESSIKIMYSGAGGLPTLITPTSIDTSSHTLSFSMPQFGTFKFVVPAYSHPITQTVGAFSLVADQVAVIGDPSADPRYAQFLNVLASSGIVPVSGRAWSLSGSSAVFSPPARMTLSYTSAELAASGAVSGTVFLGQYGLGNAARIPLFSVQADTAVSQTFSALLSVFASTPVIGVFGRAPSVAARDLLSPQTSLSVGGATLPQGGAAIVASTASIAFSAVDPVYPGAPTSGVVGTFYLLDQPFVSGASTPGQPYSGPFVVSPGTHTVAYYSRDAAGNIEVANVATIIALPPPTRTVGGMGLGVDNASFLWSIALDSGSVSLAHNDQRGVITASAALANADPAFPWSVLFDQTGTVYAVGSALAGNGADQLAVYKASPSGDSIVSSLLFDSGFNNNNFVFGSAAPGWIVGAVQTSGPIGGPGSKTFAMALWKFDPTRGLVQLTTTYARAGMDLASGVAVDDAGNLWLAGYSYSPNPRSPRAFDLAVWKYASDGKTLLAGPFIREGYLGDFNTQDVARVVVSSGIVYVATPRGRGAGGTDTALVSFDAVTGRLLSENAWRSADGASTFVSELLQDSAGRLLAAGSFDYGDTIAGLWRYGADGALQSVSQTNAGGAQGAVFNGVNLWLIVDGSTSPYLAAAETAAAGTLSDILPPRTAPTFGNPFYQGSVLYVASTTPLGFMAVDDRLAVFDGIGVGVSRTLYATDGAAYAQASTSFTLVAEGTHTVSFYSLDSEGNAEIVNSTTVAVDRTPPVVNVSALSGSTFAISALDPVVNGAASGVAAINYLVDADPNSCRGVPHVSTAPPGTCANFAYAGAFTLSLGTHTVYFQAIDNIGNGIVGSSVVTAGLPQLPVAVVATTALPGPAAGLAVTPLGDFRYVAVGGQVLRQDLEGRTLGSFGGFGAAGPGLLAADAKEGLWAADPSNGKLLRADPRGNVVRATASPPASIAGAAVYGPADPLNPESLAVADEASGSVALFDLGGGPVLAVGGGLLSRPRGTAVGPGGALYVVDAGAAQVKVLDAHFALARRFGAGLGDPDQIALAADGSAWVSDRADHALHVFDSSGGAVGVVGGVGLGALDFAAVRGLAFDPAGRLHVADGSRVVTLRTRFPTGTAPVLGALGVGARSPWAVDLQVAAPSPRAALYELRVSPQPIATDADFAAADVAPVGFAPSAPGVSDILRVPGLSPGSTYYFALRAYDAQGRVSNTSALSAATPASPAKGALATVAGFGAFGWLGDGWPATLASFGFPRGVAEDGAGNLYVTDAAEILGNDVAHTARVRRVDAATKVITTIAGGVPGFGGDGGPALQARFNNMRGVAADAAGNLYIGDSGNNRIRKIATSGIVTTIAGTGSAGFSGDGGPATQAMLNSPRFLTVASDGSVLFADIRNGRIRRVDAQTGIITTIAGNGLAASAGDGGPATQASLDIAFDVTISLARTGDVYVSELRGNRVRKIDGRTGIIATVAGNGVAASSGDGGPATQASLNQPVGLALDPVDDLYIAEFNGALIRRVDARTGVITTVGGTGVFGAGGEDGPALSAQLGSPTEMRLDAPAGVLYFADPANARISALAVDPFLASASTQTVGGKPAVAAVSTAPYTLTQASTQTAPGAILIASAAAQGLFPISQVYIVSPTAQPGASVELTFTVPAGVSTSTLAIYRFNGVAWDSGPVVAQTLVDIGGGFLQLTGLTLLTSPFAVFQRDATSPVTALSVSTPSAGAYVSTATTFALTAVDPLVDGFASGVAFTRWRVDGGTFTLSPPGFRLAGPDGPHAIDYQSQDRAGNLEVLRSTSVLLDQTPPVTTASVGAPSSTAADGALYIATTTPVSFAASDPALSASTVPGSGVNRIEVSIDSAAWTPYSAALAFAEGAHVILSRAVDNVGNVEAAHALALRADATPPVSTLVIGQPQFALSSATVLVSSLTPLAVTAVDPVVNGVASGVKQSFYSVNGATFAAFTAAFTLASLDGPQTVSFYSQDNVLNTEAVKAGTVVLDATPPTIALLSPGACPGGVCRVVKGRVPVLGSATDAHFAGYVLDFAAGQNATTGYALISSGTVAVSSAALGTWDASPLAGWQTLRLTATDLVANVSTLSLNVYVGDPGQLLILGDHGMFDLPQGVAADAAGNIYVADTNADRIAVFTATGSFVTAYGASRDAAASSTTVRLNKPKGVAVDAAGALYVADTNDDRVLKLSPDGRLLLALGRRVKAGGDGPDRFQPGRDLGQFDKPSGIAVDAAGVLYVADTNNNRVQVFSSTGALVRAFRLPPLPAAGDDERGEHDDDRSALGRPFGIAVDAAGRIYVADPAGGRALVYGATGQLLLTLPIMGADKDGRARSGRPEGIAVSTDGFCLLVSDRKLDRVLRFDALGDRTLAFGAPGRTGSPGVAIAFHKPVGLALAADGTLLVADRNNDRVERFGLPAGKTLIVTSGAGDDPGAAARDVLDRDEGGTVARSDKAGVTVPPGALADDLKITVSTLSAAGAALGRAMDQVAGAKGLAPAYAPVEYGPEGTRFTVPVTLVQPYDPRLVAAQGLSEDGLKIHYWNPLKSDWEPLDSVVDKAAHTVTAKTPHFSLYQVLGSTGAGYGVLAADASFGLKAAYAFPNPVHGGAVTLRIQPGLADAVSVRVYDVSGRKVHDSSGFSLSTLDDGNGLGAQFTYDHVWDVSGAGSGVYTYVITATKAGQADIHKTGRIGVAK